MCLCSQVTTQLTGVTVGQDTRLPAGSMPSKLLIFLEQSYIPAATGVTRASQLPRSLVPRPGMVAGEATEAGLE